MTLIQTIVSKSQVQVRRGLCKWLVNAFATPSLGLRCIHGGGGLRVPSLIFRPSRGSGNWQAFRETHQLMSKNNTHPIRFILFIRAPILFAPNGIKRWIPMECFKYRIEAIILNNNNNKKKLVCTHAEYHKNLRAWCGISEFCNCSWVIKCPSRNRRASGFERH